MEIKTITNQETLKVVSKKEAETHFYNKKEVFVKIGANQVVSASLKTDIYFPFSETEGTKFYIESKFDENCLIVTKYKNIQRFIKEELGVHCKVCEKVTMDEVKGKTIYGTLPLAYMGNCEKLYTLICVVKEKEVDDLPYEQFKKCVAGVKEYIVQTKFVKRYEKQK